MTLIPKAGQLRLPSSRHLKAVLRAACVFVVPALACSAEIAGPLPSARQLKWHELEVFGMVNFSTITYYGKEWGYGDEEAARFNPSEFDAVQIVRAAKAGGLKGLVIDAKHHGGFCLWPSKYTDYSVKSSPWKNGQGDIVGELVAACRAEGLAVGMYLSPWDRNHKDYGKPEYITYYRNQLTELLTGYGPIFEVWLDGANGGDGWYGGARERRNIDRGTYYDWPATYALIHKLQPDACIFSEMGSEVRWNGNEQGISGDPCWATFTPKHRGSGKPLEINPQTGYFVVIPNGEGNYKEAPHGHRDGRFWMPAEADFPQRNGWFWHPGGRSKTPADLVNRYFTSVGRNSAMDIGIAPDRRGLICDEDAAALKGFGDRIRAIFATNLAATARVTDGTGGAGADTLDLGALMQPVPATGVFREEDYFAWCSSILKEDDGTYHLIYSRWPRKYGFDSWLTHSEIAHAVAAQPGGPYRYVETLIPARGSHRWDAITAHNPKIEKFGKKYYLYYCSTRGDFTEAELQATARDQRTHRAEWRILRNNQRTGVAVADRLSGPWTIQPSPVIEPTGPIANVTVNPAVCRRPDGKYLMIIKGDKPGSTQRNQAVALADDPEGPFVLQPQPAIDGYDTEDASLWHDAARQRYYAIFHAHSFIGLITSQDGLQWQKAAHFNVTPKTIPMQEGRALPAARLERPFVFLEEGQPRVLSLAVQRLEKGGVDTCILLVPLKTPAPAIPTVALDFGKPTEFSVISLREDIRLGERVDEWALDAWDGRAWNEFAAGTGIGARRLWRGQVVTAGKIRLRIIKSSAAPTISEFAVYLEPESSRKEANLAARVETGLSKTGWKVIAASSEGAPVAHAIDGNPATFWHTHTAAGRQPPPQEFVVDMGAAQTLAAFLYLPRQDGCAVGNVERYSFFISADGQGWGEPVARGEFGNIRANPVQQKVLFAQPVPGRYFKFVAEGAVDDCAAVAELGVIAK